MTELTGCDPLTTAVEALAAISVELTHDGIAIDVLDENIDELAAFYLVDELDSSLA